jgi:hypothetical protein
MAIRSDPTIYRAVCSTLDALFKEHGDKVGTCINRYLRVRRETRQTENRIAELESELAGLKKVDSISRQKARKR